MPTVGSILRQTEKVSDLSYKIFKSDVSAASESVLISAPLNTSADFVKNGFGSKQALDSMSEMIENYNEQRKSFKSDLSEAMSSLKKSADEFSNPKQISSNERATENLTGTLSTLKEFAKDNVPPEERFAVQVESSEKTETSQRTNEMAEIQRQVQIENRRVAQSTPKPAIRDRFDDFAENYLVAEKNETTAEVNAKENDAEDNQMAKIRNLVRDFNSTMSYLNENRGVSNRVSALAAAFGDSGELEQSLNRIGISVNSAGELSVDENELANALSEDAKGVKEVLGNDGLAGRLNRNVNLANYQSDKLFSNITDYVGGNKEETSEALYAAGRMKTAMYTQQNAGNLLNMFT